MPELHECINRINELRQKEFSKETLTDEELREVFTLLAEVRRMRHGKSPAAEKAEKAPVAEVEDFF